MAPAPPTHTHAYTHLYLQIVATVTCEKKKKINGSGRHSLEVYLLLFSALFLWLCGMRDRSSLTRD